MTQFIRQGNVGFLRQFGQCQSKAAVLCRFALSLVVLGFFASIATGCKSTPKTPSNRLASVIITNRTPGEIEAATRMVFEKHDYELSARRDGGAMVFEKQGTWMNGMVYGDWYSGGVWERVKVFHIEIEPGSTLLDCNAYMVQE